MIIFYCMCTYVCTSMPAWVDMCVPVSFLVHFLSSPLCWHWLLLYFHVVEDLRPMAMVADSSFFLLVFVFFISPPFSILFPLSSTVLVGMAIDVITFTTGRHQTRDGWVRGRGTLFIPLSIPLSSLPSGSPCLCALFSAVRWPPEVCLLADWNRNSRPHWLATGDKLVREEPRTGWGQGWKAS